MWPIYGKKNAGTEIAFKRAQWSNFADNDFKVAVINIFKELKGTMHKE